MHNAYNRLVVVGHHCKRVEAAVNSLEIFSFEQECGKYVHKNSTAAGT
jgi:hypothetical protein